MSVNYEGNNEVIPGAVHRSPGICLTTEENPGKPQLGDRLRRVFGANGPLHLNEVCRKGEGNKERKKSSFRVNVNKRCGQKASH